MAEISSLLQVSDLHLYKKITFEGGRHWGLRAFGVKGHRHTKLFAFGKTILQDRLANNVEDIIIATGDISTDGTVVGLKLAKSFFDRSMIHENGRLACYGLGRPNQRRLIIPGNHDRYGDYFLPYESATNRSLEEIFELRDEYPYAVGYRREETRGNHRAPTLLFFVFDSTLTREAAESPNPIRRVARGLVTPEDCDWLRNIGKLLRSQDYVPDFGGQHLQFQYENTIRIALLHHHPVRKKKRGLSQLFDNNSWSIMENASAFVDACFNAEIDLVLFGHEHENYNEQEQREITDSKGVRRAHTIRFVCCPSTAEYSEPKTGFYRIDFDAAEYRMTHHEWQGTAYSPIRTYNQPYNRPLSLAAGGI